MLQDTEKVVKTEERREGAKEGGRLKEDSRKRVSG
jgi:hypothetical protein